MIPLLLATHHWHTILEKRSQVGCVFFDLSKAFDTIPHQALLNKLQLFRVSATILHWIKNYLSGRHQRVVLNGTHSQWLPVCSGVPQGSILGPLLFLIYINDLSNLALSQGAKILLYADDILLYKPINTPIDFDDLQADINTIAHWISSNHLTVNSSKTKCMLISWKRSQAHHLPPLNLNGSVIQPVEHYKYLGVWISSDLTWTKHVENVSCKARRLLGFMFRTFSPFCKPETIITLYKSQVLPIVDYACVVWDPHLKKDQYLLESVQTFALRMASRSWRVNAEELNSQFQLPTLTSRRSYLKLLMTFKFLNGLLYCPPDLFVFNASPNTRVSHSSQLVVPFTKTAAYFNSFFVSTTRLWNSLPANYVHHDSVGQFKKCIQNTFLWT